MGRFVFSRVLEQTRHQHHISRCFLTVPAPLLSLSRFFSSTWKITASDSTSSLPLPVTLDSINPKTLEEALNNLDSEGAMYLFPKKAMIEAAYQTAKTVPHAFYCKRLLNATGIVGSRFGQVPITWHFSRCSILPQKDKIPAILNRVREFSKSSNSEKNIKEKSPINEQTKKKKSSIKVKTRRKKISIHDITKRTRFQKHHRGRVKGISSHGNLSGRYALQTLESGWITSRQIEAGRKAMIRNIRRGEKIRVHIFADKTVTVRPPETRMGRGKGAPAFCVAVVKPGKIIYEMGGVSENVARLAISLAAAKLPLKTKFISPK